MHYLINAINTLPTHIIDTYMQTRSKGVKAEELSLTSGASWIHSRRVEDRQLDNVHEASRANYKLLEQGHNFWLTKITGVNPQDRDAVNKALTPYLTTLKEIIQNGVTQETQASIKISRSDLEESLRNTPPLVKDTLRCQIEEEIKHTNEKFKIKKSQLMQQATLLEHYHSTDDSANSVATEPPTIEAITKLRATLTKLFNRNKCMNILNDTIPSMQQSGTVNFVDLLGYCLYGLEKTEGKYHDPEKIDTIMGVLLECALSFADNASCADGIIERCQRDGYMIKESEARDETTHGVTDLLTQIREHYAENKLMATSDEPSPLLGLLIMDTILKKHGITKWSVCGKEENRRKLENLSPTSWQALQDHLGTEKAKLTAELAELNETNSMNQEDKKSEKETGLAKANRLKQKQTVVHKLAVLETQLDTLHGIERNRSQDSDSSIDPHHQRCDLSKDNVAPSTTSSVELNQLSIHISVEESLTILNNLIKNKTLIDLSTLPAEKKQALQEECETLGTIIDQMISGPTIDQTPEMHTAQQEKLNEFKRHHSAITEDLTHTLTDYGLTREHSRILVLTACLTKDFDKLNDCNVPRQECYWATATQQALGYLDATQQMNIPTDTGLYQQGTSYQENVQAKVVSEWLTPLHNLHDALLQQRDNLIRHLTRQNKILVIPATCRDDNQAEAILEFMVSDTLTTYYTKHGNTLLCGLAGNDAVLNKYFQNTLAQEHPDWAKIGAIFEHIMVGGNSKITRACINQLADQHPESLVLQNEHGCTPLSLAIYCHHTDIAHHLIDILTVKGYHDAVNILCPDNKTPLTLAIEKNQLAIAHKIIDILSTRKSSFLSAESNLASLALDCAIKTGQKEIANKITDIINKNFQNALAEEHPDWAKISNIFTQIIVGGYAEVANGYVTQLADIHPESLALQSEHGFTPLTHAIECHHTDIALHLIDTLTRIGNLDALNKECQNYKTPLTLAIGKKQSAIAHKLIDILSTADSNFLSAESNVASIALDCAIKLNQTDIADKLIDILKAIPGALTKVNHINQTPLSLAILKKETSIAIKLIDILTEQNIEAFTNPDESSSNLLHKAISTGQDNIAHKLIDILEKHSIKALSTKGRHGDTPLHLAIEKGQIDIAVKLIDILAKNPEALNYLNDDDELPLQLAINKGQTDIAVKLIQVTLQNNPNTLIEKGGVLYAAVSEGQITIDQKIIDALLETIPDELKEGIHTILNKRRELTENRQPIDDLLEGLLKKIAEKKALTRTNASSQGLFQTQPGSIISEQKN